MKEKGRKRKKSTKLTIEEKKIQDVCGNSFKSSLYNRDAGVILYALGMNSEAKPAVDHLLQLLLPFCLYVKLGNMFYFLLTCTNLYLVSVGTKFIVSLLLCHLLYILPKAHGRNIV